jgi:hypothetical protein
VRVPGGRVCTSNNRSSAMVYEPPPNPADWICEALPVRHASKTQDPPQAAPERRGEPITWDAIRPARRVPPCYRSDPDRLSG